MVQNNYLSLLLSTAVATSAACGDDPVPALPDSGSQPDAGMIDVGPPSSCVSLEDNVETTFTESATVCPGMYTGSSVAIKASDVSLYGEGAQLNAAEGQEGPAIYLTSPSLSNIGINSFIIYGYHAGIEAKGTDSPYSNITIERNRITGTGTTSGDVGIDLYANDSSIFSNQVSNCETAIRNDGDRNDVSANIATQSAVGYDNRGLNHNLEGNYGLIVDTSTNSTFRDNITE